MAQKQTGVNIEQAIALAIEKGMSVTFDGNTAVFTPVQVEEVVKTTAEPTKATPQQAKPNTFVQDVIRNPEKRARRKARRQFKANKYVHGVLPERINGKAYSLKEAIAMKIATKSGNPTKAYLDGRVKV